MCSVTPLRVGLVSCSKAKLDYPASAQELYMPSYVFRMSRLYAEQCCDVWQILSAKHGLVHPLTLLTPYDETLGAMPKRAREQWAQCVYAQLCTAYGQHVHVQFVVLAGRHYAAAVETLGFGEVEQPLRGLGTGHRRQKLAAMVAGLQA